MNINYKCKGDTNSENIPLNLELKQNVLVQAFRVHYNLNVPKCSTMQMKVEIFFWTE